jgi:hypothetical protein
MGRTYRISRRPGSRPLDYEFRKERENKKEWVRRRALELRELRREKE